MWPNPQFPADLVTLIEEILNGKLHFLCSVSCSRHVFQTSTKDHEVSWQSRFQDVLWRFWKDRRDLFKTSSRFFGNSKKFFFIMKNTLTLLGKIIHSGYFTSWLPNSLGLYCMYNLLLKVKKILGWSSFKT